MHGTTWIPACLQTLLLVQDISAVEEPRTLPHHVKAPPTLLITFNLQELRK